MRVVIDTNIIVSAFLGGKLSSVLDRLLDNSFKLIVSQDIVDEYFDVLSRPKFRIKQTELADFATLLNQKADLVSPTEAISIIQDDPSDNKFLEAALAGSARYVVSGDAHLLTLKIFRGIPVITASDFLAEFDI